ncbi:MAG TPA: nicotinate-nucleotide--dimethylbenzimidazole phosphoribosyltransferase [Sediminibacterium sp.]|nr:nicotinate-nucleotide--dimethylbenzimidazole phosphoribosyltransferase [Sediminibacterium sp.]
MNQSLKEQLQQKINRKTKPIGALGLLESIALNVGLIQETLSPVITNPAIVVFAADHGIAATGLVNPYPQAVTAQMVLNFTRNGAAINVFTRQNDIRLVVVDAGVNADFSAIPSSDWFIHAKQGAGTKNYLEEDSMTAEQALNTIEQGRKIVEQLAARECNCISFGEMGIGNTSSATLIMSAITGKAIRECTGRGTGANDEQLNTKINTLETVFRERRLDLLRNDPYRLLSKAGGFEIAMMTGAYLQAYAEKMVIVVDGFISTSALMLAHQMQPEVLNNCLFAHASGEQGHAGMLEYFKADPILQLGMRLGEGTGAALAIPVIKSAVAFLNEMASFDEAQVSSI